MRRKTVKEFLVDEWLPAIKGSIKASTWESYSINVKTHIVPRLGALLLAELKPANLTTFYAELQKTRSPGGRKALSPKSARNVAIIVHKALADAVQWGYLTRNVADNAVRPKATSKEMRIWTAEQLRTFYASIADDPFEGAWMVAGQTGMRRGEVLGLRRCDLDLERAQLSVRQSLVLVGYVPTISEPKTKRSVRVIDLDERTIAALRRQIVRQGEERMLLGLGKPADNDLVFTRPDGSPVNPDVFSQAFERLAKHAELPTIRLHDLRHTHATVLLKAGVAPKVVSERLGHASIAITMDTYSHVIPGMQADAAKRAAEFVWG